MSLPRYPEYNDCGVGWLGEVPAHWDIYALKRLANLKSGESITAEQIDEEGTYPVFGGNGLRGYTASFTHDGRFALIGRQGALCGNINYSYGRFWASEHAVVATPIKEISTTWLGELMRAMNLNQYSVSAAQPGLSVEIISNLGVPYPPLHEQTAIATFLDRETAKIDVLIAEQEKLLTLLAEKRQATISHAVTKGLNTDVQMKDSGVEWLGEVPRHWDVTPLGSICSLIQTGPFGSQLHAEDYIEDGTPVVNPSNLIDGQIVADWKCSITSEMANSLSQHILRIGDIVFGRRGEMGRCALVKPDNAGWLCGTGSLNLRLKIGKPEFIVTYLGTPMVRELLKLESVGSTMDNLNTGILSRVRVPLPPDEEQQEISAFLDTEITRLDALANEANRAITLLKERRTALISAAVTGKIDVRHLAN